MKRNVRYWLPVVLWGAIIFLFSTDAFSSARTSSVIGPVLRFLMPGISTDAVEAVHAVVRKFGHVAEYFILGVFLFRAFHLSLKGRRVFISSLLAALALALYAAGDEIHQSFVPTRTASIIDVGIDSAGGVMAQIVSVLWWKRHGPG